MYDALLALIKAVILTTFRLAVSGIRNALGKDQNVPKLPNFNTLRGKFLLRFIFSKNNIRLWQNGSKFGFNFNRYLWANNIT
jgi:hypothetical protein